MAQCQDKTSSDLFHCLTPSSHYASYKSFVLLDCSVSVTLENKLTLCMPYSFTSCSDPSQILLGFWSISPLKCKNIIISSTTEDMAKVQTQNLFQIHFCTKYMMHVVRAFSETSVRVGMQALN